MSLSSSSRAILLAFSIVFRFAESSRAVVRLHLVSSASESALRCLLLSTASFGSTGSGAKKRAPYRSERPDPRGGNASSFASPPAPIFLS